MRLLVTGEGFDDISVEVESWELVDNKKLHLMVINKNGIAEPQEWHSDKGISAEVIDEV